MCAFYGTVWFIITRKFSMRHTHKRSRVHDLIFSRNAHPLHAGSQLANGQLVWPMVSALEIQSPLVMSREPSPLLDDDMYCCLF